MSKVAWSRAATLDYMYTKQMWKDLCEILEKHYKVKSINKNEVFLHIPKLAAFDIEVYPGSKQSMHKFSIHVWDLRNSSRVIYHKEVDSLVSVIKEVDEIIRTLPSNINRLTET